MRSHRVSTDTDLRIQPAISPVLLESEDLAASLFGVATSTEPFDAWFRNHVKAVHGVDLTSGMNLPEQILDLSADN